MMSRITSGAAALSIAGLVVVGLQAPAVAQEGQPGNPGQGSERCEAGGANGNQPNYPPGRRRESISDSRVERGQRVSASSGCSEFAPGQLVRFGVQTKSGFQQLGTVIATADGEAIATFTVPLNLANGQQQFVFRGLGLNGVMNEVRIPFVVTGGPTAAAPGGGQGAAPGGGQGAAPGGGTISVGGVQLPRTGSDTLVPLLLAGVGLVTVGTGMVVVARRRRTAFDALA